MRVPGNLESKQTNVPNVHIAFKHVQTTFAGTTALSTGAKRPFNERGQEDAGGW